MMSLLLLLSSLSLSPPILDFVWKNFRYKQELSLQDRRLSKYGERFSRFSSLSAQLNYVLQLQYILCTPALLYGFAPALKASAQGVAWTQSSLQKVLKYESYALNFQFRSKIKFPKRKTRQTLCSLPGSLEWRNGKIAIINSQKAGISINHQRPHQFYWAFENEKVLPLR